MLLCSVIVTALLWLPFGFHLGGVIEEWGFQSCFDQNGAVFVCDAGSPIPAMQMRPLVLSPYALAYVCDPNSFFFHHLILMAAICLICFAFALIVWSLTRSREFALFAGFLLVLYPADTMQLCFRGLHINLSLALALGGAACLLFAYEAPGRLAKILLTGMAALMAAVAVLMYEASMGFLVLPFIILFIRSGFSQACRLSWTQKWISLGWIGAFVGCASYEIWAVTHHHTYQSDIADSPQAILSHVPLIFSIGFVRSLAGGWFDAFGILFGEYHNYLYLIVMVAASLGLIFLKPRRQSPAESGSGETSWLFIARLVGGGLLLLFIGYLPTLPSYAHILITQRTFLFSSPGACLVWLAVILSLLKLNRFFAVMLASVLILGGSAAQLFQFNHYVRLWENQRNILKTIVDSVPSLPKGKSLLIIDASGRLNDDWMLLQNLSSALSYIYHQPVHADICLQPGNLWEALDSSARPGLCVETADSWKFFRLPPLDQTKHAPLPNKLIQEIPKSALQIVKIEADGSSASVQPQQQVLASMNGDKVRLSRYLNLLSPPSRTDRFGLFYLPDNPSEYRWDFGRWWSLDLPTQGTGWRPSEWAVNYFLHDSFSWKVEPVATLLFKLFPEKSPYVIEGTFLFLSPNTRQQDVKLQMNGRDLSIVWTGPKTFKAEPDSAQMKSGMNELEFIVPEDSQLFNLSVALDSISVHPK